MNKRNNVSSMLGIAALAMLFGATGVYGQSTSTDSSGMTKENKAGQMSTTGQNETSSVKPSTSGSSGQQGSSASGKTLSRSDQNLVRDLAYSNLSEIEAAKLALDKSKNDQVKTFAQKMVDDHTQAQKDLEQLAQAKGMTLPTDPDNKHKAEVKRLSALQGDKFDKMYMSQGGLSDHRATHKLLNTAEQRAGDADLKALVAKMKPIVDQHLTMAQDMSSGKGAASGSSQGPSGTSKSGNAGTSGVSGPSGDTDKPEPAKK